MNPFSASHVRRSHTILLKASIGRVFPLFTPIGEKSWVRDWNPRFLHPPDGETRAGMVFTTGHGGEETFWSLVDLDEQAHRARYARVTPSSRFGFVEVACEPAGPQRTRSTVTYTYTALSEAGNAYIAALTEEEFRRMIDTWQSEINAYLERQGEDKT